MDRAIEVYTDFRPGAAPRADLDELWSRIAFNVMVSNTDDHLRDHGFLLEPAGWRLSEAYDALDLGLVRSVAPSFRVEDARAVAILDRIAEHVRTWNTVASDAGIPHGERGDMADAFALAAVR